MAIIHMGSSFDYSGAVRTLRTVFHDGEYCPLPGTNGMNDDKQGDTLYETHHGLCLYDYERNGYDDSDWYMVVWDPVTKTSKDVFFATTRGWSYPCYASKADATPEVRAEFKAYVDYNRRRSEILKRRTDRKHMAEIARRAGLQRIQVESLKAAVGSAWQGIERLITANLRSGFRKSMRDQVIAWATNPAPKYRSPLSPKQMAYL